VESGDFYFFQGIQSQVTFYRPENMGSKMLVWSRVKKYPLLTGRKMWKMGSKMLGKFPWVKNVVKIFDPKNQGQKFQNSNLKHNYLSQI
jgi:hypothetical protein